MLSSWLATLNRRSIWLLISMAALAVLGLQAFGAAHAAPDPAGVIHGCVTRSNQGTIQGNDQGRIDQGGVLHIVDAGTTCPRGEQALSWNTQGPPGPPGADSTAKFANVHCPPGQFVSSFLSDGTPICQPPPGLTGSAVVGGGTDSLRDVSTIGMFAWGNGGFSANGAFLERFGVIPVGGTLANFTADIQYAPLGGAKWTFTLVAYTADHQLVAVGPACSIPAGKYECFAAGSLVVQPGWTVLVFESQAGGAAQEGMGSWSATFQPGP